MNTFTPNTSPAYIRRQLPVLKRHHPEIAFAFLALTPDDQEVILRQASVLANLFRNMGAASVLELLYKLARAPYKLTVIQEMRDRETAELLVWDVWRDVMGDR